MEFLLGCLGIGAASFLILAGFAVIVFIPFIVFTIGR